MKMNSRATSQMREIIRWMLSNPGQRVALMTPNGRTRLMALRRFKNELATMMLSEENEKALYEMLVIVVTPQKTRGYKARFYDECVGPNLWSSEQRDALVELRGGAF